MHVADEWRRPTVIFASLNLLHFHLATSRIAFEIHTHTHAQRYVWTFPKESSILFRALRRKWSGTKCVCVWCGFLLCWIHLYGVTALCMRQFSVANVKWIIAGFLRGQIIYTIHTWADPVPEISQCVMHSMYFIFRRHELHAETIVISLVLRREWERERVRETEEEWKLSYATIPNWS